MVRMLMVAVLSIVVLMSGSFVATGEPKLVDLRAVVDDEYHVAIMEGEIPKEYFWILSVSEFRSGKQHMIIVEPAIDGSIQLKGLTLRVQGTQRILDGNDQRDEKYFAAITGAQQDRAGGKPARIGVGVRSIECVFTTPQEIVILPGVTVSK